MKKTRWGKAAMLAAWLLAPPILPRVVAGFFTTSPAPSRRETRKWFSECANEYNKEGWKMKSSFQTASNNRHMPQESVRSARELRSGPGFMGLYMFFGIFGIVSLFWAFFSPLSDLLERSFLRPVGIFWSFLNLLCFFGLWLRFYFSVFFFFQNLLSKSSWSLIRTLHNH